jgi:putative hydrolase of the HAD superfamily
MSLVFDFAGVLFRWQPHEIVASVLPALAPTRAEADRLVADIFQGYGGDWGEFDRGELGAGVLAERLARRVPGLGVEQALALIDAIPAALLPIAGTVVLLQRLHARGHALYFLSNMPEPYARHLETTHDFLRLFRRGVFSARVKMVKPEAAIFEHAAQAFGIEPARTLFIDDMAQNVAAARAAGWQAHHFDDPAGCEAELRRRALL